MRKTGKQSKETLSVRVGQKRVLSYCKACNIRTQHLNSHVMVMLTLAICAARVLLSAPFGEPVQDPRSEYACVRVCVCPKMVKGDCFIKWDRLVTPEETLSKPNSRPLGGFLCLP